MSKKFFITIAIVLVIFVLALLGYYFILKSDSNVANGKTPSFRDFLPFGGSSETSTTTTEISRPVVPETPPVATEFTKKVRKIWPLPVSGFGMFDTKAGTVLRHIEKSTGHIHETEMFSPKQERISNTTITLPYVAEWGTSSSTLITQYLKQDNHTIDTYYLVLKPTDLKVNTDSESAKFTPSSTLLSPNISQVVVNGNSMFSLVVGDTGSNGFISNLDGSGIKQIWNSPIKEVVAQYVNSNTIALNTAHYPNVNGYLYLLNTNGSFKKVLGNIPGLTSLVSPDAKKVLGLSDDGMFIYNLVDGSNLPQSPKTFPEKCVWSKKNLDILYCAVPNETINTGSLNSWYMGLSRYTDSIWKFDTKNNVSTMIVDLNKETGESIDTSRIKISDSDSYLGFINKRDGSFWTVDLTK
jgi:hypothetical protein